MFSISNKILNRVIEKISNDHLDIRLIAQFSQIFIDWYSLVTMIIIQPNLIP